MWIINSMLICMTIYYILKLVKILGTKILLLVYILFNFAQQIVSILYLNSSVFVIELKKTTYYVPESSPLFILYTNIFLIFLCYFAQNKFSVNSKEIIARSTNVSKSFCYGAIVLTIIFAIYSMMDLIISGIPMFIETITHYNYYSTYSTLPFASTVNNWLGISMFLIGFTYVHIEKRYIRVTCVLLVIATMVIRILMGFRMSGLIDIPLNFLSVVALLSNVKFKNIKQIIRPKYFIWGIVIVLTVCIIFIATTIGNGNATNISLGVDILINRAFGLGNHLWWAIEADNTTGNSIFGHNILNEIKSIFLCKTQYDVNSGMYYIMKKYGNSYIVNVDIKDGIRYAATFITTSVYTWGYLLAIIPIALMAKITINFISSIEYALKADKFIQLLLLCKIWGTFTTFLIASGTYTEWLNPENYMYFILYFLIHRWGRKYKLVMGTNSRSLRKG